MTISAKIIEDSVAPNGKRLTTLELKYPRFIHAEFMTHRVFGRNAGSSRAIPFKRMIKNILADTAMPIHWGKNQPGMQAKAELSPMRKAVARFTWFRARDAAITMARAMNRLGVHKQIVNRLVEPFSHIVVIVTATEWDNFFALRIHPDAQPEINELAKQIYREMAHSKPAKLGMGQWHLPYVRREERNNLVEAQAMSVARCARVSYLTHDGLHPDREKDIALYDRLIVQKPAHASPCEHQATPLAHADQRSRNLVGWFQLREELNV